MKGNKVGLSAVYKIVNTVTGDCYVGSSRNVKSRWKSHKCPSTWKLLPNSQMYKDMQTYGVDRFCFQILCPVEPEHLKEVEQELIEMIRPTYNSIRANGQDIEMYRDHRKKWRESENGKELRHKARRRYYGRVCSYNGETLTLSALATRFHRAGIEHPVLEAKKYLKDD